MKTRFTAGFVVFIGLLLKSEEQCAFILFIQLHCS